MNNDKVKKFSKDFLFSFSWLAILVFVIDIVTKWSFQNNLEEYQLIPIIDGFFWVTLQHNVGAAFSFLAGSEPWKRIILLCISIIMSAAILVYYIIKYKKLNAWYKAALMLMFAGAFGNLIDRAFYWESIVGFNGVIDWIKVTSWFPVFNIADSALVVGVGIIIVLLIIEIVKDTIKKNKEGAYSMSPKEYEEKMKDIEETNSSEDTSKDKENNNDEYNS